MQMSHIVLALVLGAGVSISAVADYSLELQEMRAQLAASRHTTLSAELGAKIASISVKEGDSFTLGQVLVFFVCCLFLALFVLVLVFLVVVVSSFAGFL